MKQILKSIGVQGSGKTKKQGEGDRETQENFKRQQGTGQSWQKNKVWGATQVGGQAGKETEEGGQADIWRRAAEMGHDAEERMHDSPQLLVQAGDLHQPNSSLFASAPSSSTVPPAQPSPTQ